MIFTRGVEPSSPSANSRFQSALQVRNFGPTQDTFHLLQPATSSCDGSKIFAALAGTHRVCMHRTVIIEADKKIGLLRFPDFGEQEFSRDRARRKSAQTLVSARD